VLEALDLRRAPSKELKLPNRRPARYLRSNSATVSSEREVRALLEDEELAAPDIRVIVDEGLTKSWLVLSTLKAREPCMLFLLERRGPDARRSLGERGDFRSCSVINLAPGLAMPLGFLTRDLLKVRLSKRTAGPPLLLFFLDAVLLGRLAVFDLRLDFRGFDVRLTASCSLSMPASRAALRFSTPGCCPMKLMLGLVGVTEGAKSSSTDGRLRLFVGRDVERPDLVFMVVEDLISGAR
jgi:hypothetical protein